MNIDLLSFGALEVFDEHRHRITLRSLWQHQSAVIVFVRHFG